MFSTHSHKNHPTPTSTGWLPWIYSQCLFSNLFKTDTPTSLFILQSCCLPQRDSQVVCLPVGKLWLTIPSTRTVCFYKRTMGKTECQTIIIRQPLNICVGNNNMSVTLKISFVALVVCWTTRQSEISYDAFKMFQNEFGKSV